ncbi:MAG: hypothetical protein KJN76_01320, partial [Eudoraea sp.]|nr:hypothetical protein [Eudoraea sp.]
MKQHNNRSINIPYSNKVLIIVGTISVLVMLLIDVYFLKINIFHKEVPVISISNIVRSLVVLVALILIVSGAVSSKCFEGISLRFLNEPFKMWAIRISYLLAICFLMLFVYRPDLFSGLSLEDGIIEWTSALLFFGCALIMLFSFFQTLGLSRAYRVPKIVMGSLIFGFFFIA